MHEEICRSTYDPEVLLFSRFYPDILGGKHMVVAVKIDERWFILTVYVTRRLRDAVTVEGRRGCRRSKTWL
jgi:hypothetical protein